MFALLQHQYGFVFDNVMYVLQIMLCRFVFAIDNFNISHYCFRSDF